MNRTLYNGQLLLGIVYIICLSSCTGFYGGVGIGMNPLMFANTNINNDDRGEQYDDSYIIQQYDRYSETQKNSQYKIENRKVEFEYYLDRSNNNKYITTRFLTDQSEETVQPELLVLLEKRDFKLFEETFSSEPYVETNSYTSNTPVTRYETVTNPGGVDIVTRPDGSVEHVHRPISTSTVAVTENQETQYTDTKEVILNSGTYQLDERDIRRLSKYALFDYAILIGQDTLYVYPSERQVNQLVEFINN